MLTFPVEMQQTQKGRKSEVNYELRNLQLGWCYKAKTHQPEMSNEEKDSGVVFDHSVIMSH